MGGGSEVATPIPLDDASGWVDAAHGDVARTSEKSSPAPGGEWSSASIWTVRAVDVDSTCAWLAGAAIGTARQRAAIRGGVSLWTAPDGVTTRPKPGARVIGVETGRIG